jgi:hypothetical protein
MSDQDFNGQDLSEHNHPCCYTCGFIFRSNKKLIQEVKDLLCTNCGKLLRSESHIIGSKIRSFFAGGFVRDLSRGFKRRKEKKKGKRCQLREFQCCEGESLFNFCIIRFNRDVGMAVCIVLGYQKSRGQGFSTFL